MPPGESTLSVYGALAKNWPRSDWLQTLCAQAEEVLARHAHGDLPGWLAALAKLPRTPVGADLNRDMPVLGAPAADKEALKDTLMRLHPWRKGPLALGGVPIDTEWRSDWKWARVAPHVDLRGNRVLDIGCGNGYFGWRMLGAGARLVVGIDPTLVFVMQWLACRHFAGDSPNYVLPLGIEQLPDLPAAMDTVFSMGVLYHRRDPHEHLRRLHGLLRSGGTLVLETLVLPRGRDRDLLVPEGRYARMKNVWGLPGQGLLLDWVEQAGFRELKLVDVTRTTVNEQRSTGWMRFESLPEALHPDDHRLTVEGLPAPIRATVVART
jgi:tRNA (mo5U34)-methyltransferase